MLSVYTCSAQLCSRMPGEWSGILNQSICWVFIWWSSRLREHMQIATHYRIIRGSKYICLALVLKHIYISLYSFFLIALHSRQSNENRLEGSHKCCEGTQHNAISPGRSRDLAELWGSIWKCYLSVTSVWGMACAHCQRLSLKIFVYVCGKLPFRIFLYFMCLILVLL